MNCQDRDIDLPTTRLTSASRYDHPAAFNDSTDLSCPQLSSSCIQRLDRPQLTRIKHLHDSTYASYPHRMPSCAHPRLDDTSYRHHPSSWRPHTTASDFTYTFLIPAIKLSLLLYLLPCLFVPFIVFGCHYSHALNLNSFAGSTHLSAPQYTLHIYAILFFLYRGVAILFFITEFQCCWAR